MRASEQEYQDALEYLRTRLAQPQPEVERWLNSIVDAWISSRKKVWVRRHDSSK